MRTMRKRDWLLLIAGVLVMTLALAAVMDANAQNYLQIDPLNETIRLPPRPLTRNDVAPACRTYPQPEGCPALPWYELSYFVPLERQQQIVQQIAPRVISMLGDIQGAGNTTTIAGCGFYDHDGRWIPSDCASAAPDRRACYEVNGAQTVEIPCASNLPAARRSLRRSVRRLQRNTRRRS